ncbi:MAG: sulfotransferase family protein, partial [Limisphaerales bacterium]
MTTLFVVGVFRSGTSLLYALLNQHPDIALMYECDVWNFPRFLLPLRFCHDWTGRLEFYTNALSRHHLAEEDSVCELRTPDDLYRVFGRSKNARIIGEKSPSYCDRLAQLAQNHPHSRFILIWRDPLEIYQSVEDAARNSRFFRRPGMLERLIFYHEKMIAGAARLIQSGNQVHHVTYEELINQTEESCRGICRFLEIEYDSRMNGLAGADLSAIYDAPHLSHLRLGKIGRRAAKIQAAPGVAQKLQRFQNRWNRLRQGLLNFKTGAAAGPEPGILERVRHGLSGRLLCSRDSAIRVGFEFLPLPWLRTYRQAKSWFNEGRPPPEHRPSLSEEFGAHKATILAGLVVLGLVALADYFTGAAVSLMPFY